MSSKKKGLKGLKIYRDQQIENDCVLLPYKGTDKIPDEMIENKIPKWCEPGDSLYEFLTEQIRKNMVIVELFFVHTYQMFLQKIQKKIKINEIFRII